MPKIKLKLEGERFGRLLVRARSHVDKQRHIHWHCECDCGNFKKVSGIHLKSGHTRSCGCLQSEVATELGEEYGLRPYNMKYPKMSRQDWLKYSTYLQSRTSKYKLTEQALRDMMDEQRGCCDICKRSLDHYQGTTFNVDHDHKTGNVRGLLCRNCNVAIGNMQDNPVYLRSGADYLEKHNA